MSVHRLNLLRKIERTTIQRTLCDKSIINKNSTSVEGNCCLVAQQPWPMVTAMHLYLKLQTNSCRYKWMTWCHHKGPLGKQLPCSNNPTLGPLPTLSPQSLQHDVNRGPLPPALDLGQISLLARTVQQSNIATNSTCYVLAAVFFHSVLWHCWLGDRKAIWPVKTWMLVLLVVTIWLQLCTSCSSSCHHHFHHPWLQ